MPAARDLEPTALTESERLEHRRGEAGFAFEMMPQSRFDHFNKGATDHLEDSADVADRAIRLWESMPPHKR